MDPEKKLGPAATTSTARWAGPAVAANPMLGCSGYRTPVKGLYLCGAGANPGGGVTGIPGHNAAREMLRDGLRPVRDPNI
jgi:phytoene dehydrogenase-like protein